MTDAKELFEKLQTEAEIAGFAAQVNIDAAKSARELGDDKRAVEHELGAANMQAVKEETKEALDILKRNALPGKLPEDL
jgi:hypothetical protein